VTPGRRPNPSCLPSPDAGLTGYDAPVTHRRRSIDAERA
jgi:hypothetical protein